jgi:AraC-like DNA-binding protein
VLAEGEKYMHRVIPCGLPELTLFLGKRPRLTGNKDDFEDNFILTGHQKNFHDLQIEETLSVFSIGFQPQGLMMFFRLPLSELYNLNIPLKYVDRDLEKKILPRLTDERSFEKRVQIVELHFLELLKRTCNLFEFQRINHAIELIRQTRGAVSIDYLASETCLGRKQFERLFSRMVGSTPKQYLKTVRMQLSLYLKSRNDFLNITDLAYESGYYDQAHFINEFKALTGLTPKRYFDNFGSFSDFFE